MKIPLPTQSYEQQEHLVSTDEEEEDDFSSSLSYCSSSYVMDQIMMKRKNSFSGGSYGAAHQQLYGNEEEERNHVIWCDVCKQEGFEEAATHYCSTCFKENQKDKSNRVIVVQQNDERESLEEEEDESNVTICHYCQYHANRHNRRDPLHQIVSIRQERIFASSSLLRSGSFMSSASSFDSNMSNSSPIPFFTTGSTSTGPLFNYGCNGNNSSSNNMLASSNIVRYCFKHEEAIPLNTYCRTCELVICSQCALSKAHKGHLIELIKDVENSERMQLGEHVKVLKQSFEEWEEEFSVHDEDLEEELTLIDEREESLTYQINLAFDEMKECLEKRRNVLIEQVEQSSHENKQSVHNILKMKKESKELLGEFDNLEEMSGFDVIDKKLNRLNLIIVLYEKMQKEFKTRKLSDLHRISLDKFASRKNIIQHHIDELGQVVKKTNDDSGPSSTSVPINFKHIETIGSASNSNNKHVQFSFPSDVKISHQHACIVVADFGNKKIRVLDLITRQFKYDIDTASAPRNISIDHTDDDSIIVSCADHCVYKYSLLNQGKSIVWRSGSPNESGNSQHLFKYPRASIVDIDGNVYVCDHGNHRIKVLTSSNGQFVKIIGIDQNSI
ncbi:NHL repeat domain-containing protein [Naegleria gruberi]|uniref:NHL repeat domain-containing protein n=1 Tax=Naegleria gruberi TaxID=5762 RepID=D2VCD0_NAEGR|nr:NHL repeat domain-containing protein [Naegleria gruberi]EFC45630.1 NHL repeat domain-containing protein [Naegleria gruberi]|eukprot:XP_002678374.1 NHL repeat domain-containing protein [Naegleria gruberi strain NEG-M]